ncbi:hypothetical protein ACN27J_01100 [Solwaraspora sp. WMMB762]|uniref:hypothetical protein n=1 Tax=Solwaraspora sp. WMMB762 TaxID=3404120 RepID=UPI003B9622AF
MLYRIGALLAASIVTVAGWAGPAQAEPWPATVSTPTATPACPPALPLTGLVAGVTQTSVTVSYRNAGQCSGLQARG